jgi:hypothetical protein
MSTCNTMVKQVVQGIMTFAVGSALNAFGLVTGNEGVYIPQTNLALNGIRVCVAVLPMISALISLILLKRFKMTKDDHTMIRAAIATKKKYGSVALTEYEKERCELLCGYKLSDTWLGECCDNTEQHTLDKDAEGNYMILNELKAKEVK